MPMNNTLDLLITEATVLLPDPKTGRLHQLDTSVGLREGKIAHIGSNSVDAKQTIKAKGLHLLPGAIDSQVHFREPGYPEKEDLASGTRAAVYGGVTSVFEMPNTNPPTLTAIDVTDKMSRAKGRAWCNYAFYVGASPANVDRLAELEKLPGVCGVKMFMGSSTGNLVVGEDSIIDKALKNGVRRIAVHSEDETRLKERKKIVLENPGQVGLHHVWRDVEVAMISTQKIVAMAKKHNRKVHILHVTSADEAKFLAQHKDIASFEVTPQHLTLFAPDCYERLGTLAQMNPPIREKEHLEALWQAVLNGTADVLGSDHAPHTLAEKKKVYPESPSGMTGVQTMLPIMLHHAVQGKVTVERVVELLTLNPARLFKIKNKGQISLGFDADLTLVDLKANKQIKNSWIQSTCGWSPFDGMTLKASVNATLIGGQVVMRDDELIGKPHGQPLKFDI